MQRSSHGHLRGGVLALVALLLCLPSVSHGASPDPAAADEFAAARAPVESLHDLLLSIMKDADELGFLGRYERLLSHLDESFDLEFMARISIGSAWKDLDEQQRANFTDLSRRLSAANYADNFDGYGGQSFETRSEEPAARGTIVVKTELVQVDDDDVQFDYRMRKSDGLWRIIDVQLDGKVSEITLRRADYRSAIERKGFDELVKALEKRIVKLSKQ